MKKIFLLILTALAFASCTLYMDEPEDDKKGKDDNIENGDGFSAPRTDVTADGTTTYQFNPTTKVFDETNSQYVLNAEDSVVWLSTSTPYEMIPRVGDGVFSRFSETFPDGMIGEAASVTKENGMIKCVCTKTALDNVFEVLEMKQSFSVGDYLNSVGKEGTLAQMQNKAMMLTREVSKVSQPVIDFSFEVNTEDFSVDLAGETKKWLTFDKDIHGKMPISYKKYESVDFELSLSERTFKCVMTDSTVQHAGIFLSGHGGVTARLLGSENDYLKKVPPFNIPLGSMPLRLTLSPSVIAYFKGKIEGGIKIRRIEVTRSGFVKEGKNKDIKKVQWQKTTADYELEPEANFGVKAGIKVAGDVVISDLTGTLNGGISFYFDPQAKIEAGYAFTSEGTYITNPGKASHGIEIGLDLCASVKFATQNILNWRMNVANHYFPFGITRFDPEVISLDVIPNDVVSGGTQSRYLAKLQITDMGKKDYRTPYVAVYSKKGMFMMEVPLSYKRKVGQVYEYECDIEIPKTDNNIYIAKVFYINKSGNRYYYTDEIPFGVKVDMQLSNVRQASSYYDSKSKNHYGFEARGVLKSIGGLKVTNWGLRFELFKKDGSRATLSKSTYFSPRDGTKSWGVKINAKRKQPLILKVTPLYKTSYGTNEKVMVLEDKAVKITLDPDYGECTEPDWAEPDTYIDLSQTK